MGRDARKDEQAAERVWELAKAIDFCMFVTWDGERQRARPLSARVDRAAGEINFLVDASGHVDEQIARFPRVTLAFADVRSHDYVVITGTAIVSEDRARIRDLWTSADKAWWSSAEDPSIRVVTVAPEDAEFWDGPNRLMAGAKMLFAAVTGTRPAFGDNRKVEQI